MTKKCSIYIDEAGDLGVNRGTQWFVLSAVVVDQEYEKQERQAFKNLKSRLNLNTIHFRKISSFERRCYIVDNLFRIPLTHIHVLVDTQKLHISSFKGSDMNPSFIYYNYACRYLLERVSWLLRDTDRIGTVVLSSRGTRRDNELIDYIKNKLIPYNGNQLADRFDKIMSRAAASWDMLQLADVCATSMFYAYERNQYGFCTPCFMKRIKTSLYRYNGKLNNYGIKFFSDDMHPDKSYFAEHIICGPHSAQ